MIAKPTTDRQSDSECQQQRRVSAGRSEQGNRIETGEIEVSHLLSCLCLSFVHRQHSSRHDDELSRRLSSFASVAQLSPTVAPFTLLFASSIPSLLCTISTLSVLSSSFSSQTTVWLDVDACSRFPGQKEEEKDRDFASERSLPLCPSFPAKALIFSLCLHALLSLSLRCLATWDACMHVPVPVPMHTSMCSLVLVPSLTRTLAAAAFERTSK